MQLHRETGGLRGGGEGEADLSRGERPRGSLSKVEFENRGVRTNARRLEQWICDLGRGRRRGLELGRFRWTISEVSWVLGGWIKSQVHRKEELWGVTMGVEQSSDGVLH